MAIGPVIHVVLISSTSFLSTIHPYFQSGPKVSPRQLHIFRISRRQEHDRRVEPPQWQLYSHHWDKAIHLDQYTGLNLVS